MKTKPEKVYQLVDPDTWEVVGEITRKELVKNTAQAIRLRSQRSAACCWRIRRESNYEHLRSNSRGRN